MFFEYMKMKLDQFLLNTLYYYEKREFSQK